SETSRRIDARMRARIVRLHRTFAGLRRVQAARRPKAALARAEGGKMAAARTDEWLISVDDHIIEPTNASADRLPATHPDLGPRWIQDDKGEAWVFGGVDRYPIGTSITGGAIWPPERRPPPFMPLAWSQIEPACYDAKARIQAMNSDGV